MKHTYTEEQKDLLFKDLCARLNYGVKVQTDEVVVKTLNGIALPDYIGIDESFYSLKYMGCKPYLFPLSSMTEEQLLELSSISFENSIDSSIKTLNWCYKNHLDINNLIPMGLANDATNLKIY